jgi:DNA-binding SARP family transcriptional activator/tetratricopeptide (TPR) repeat protein
MLVEINFKILGPPELQPVGQGRPAVVSPQIWTVLASFLMVPNVPVPADILIDRLWGMDPPPKASATIRSYIWRIDKLLSQVSGNEIRLKRHGRGYALKIDPHVVDIHQFRSLTRQAAALAGSREIQGAAELLREAEMLWRGEPLGGLPGGWISRLRYSLEEEYRDVVTRRIDLDLALGQHAALIAELAELVQQYPLDEKLSARLQTAMYRCGRQADALEAHRKIRASLAELGIDPGAELVQLHQRILQHDPELSITPAYRRIGEKDQPNTLPSDLTDFTGRSDEMLLLSGTARQDDRPVVWIIEGMGGVGKTALAVHAAYQVAHRYPDARLFVSLRANDPVREPLDPADALRELLAMLDIPASRIPGTLRERSALWRAELACRRAVLVFDDATDPEHIAPLLPGTGDCLIMVTSRLIASSWGTASVLQLPVLPQTEAAALFAQLAGSAADSLAQAANVVRWCGGLPLAIRLTASYMRSAATTDVLSLLDEPSEPVSGNGPGSVVNNRIQAAFQASYQRLPSAERRFLRYLGTSPCHRLFAHPGAAMIQITPAQSRTALAMLARHHLLEKTGPGQYGFHDMVRRFAAARFIEEEHRGEIRHAVGRLADYYWSAVSRANLVRARPSQTESPEADSEMQDLPFADTPGEAEEWLASEWENVLRVAEHCAGHEFKRRCADLIHVICPYLETSGHWDEARAAHQAGLQACRELNDIPGIARSAFDLSLTCMRTGRSKAALQHATDAATAYGACGDQTGKAAALDRAGLVHRNAARFREALAHHQEALKIFREVGDRGGQAKALVHAGAALWYLGRLQEEMEYLSQALEIYCQDGNRRGQAITLNNIGTVQHHQGLHRDATRSYQASHDIFREIGGRQNLAIADHNLGRIQLYKGNYSAAIGIYREVLVTYRQLGDPQHEAYALADIGTAYKSGNRFDEALAHYEKAASAAEKAGDRYAHAEILLGIAEAYFGSGRLDAALENYEQAMKIAGEIETPYLKGKALSGIAETILHAQGTDAAKIFLREALDIFTQIGVPETGTVEIRLQTLDAQGGPRIEGMA